MERQALLVPAACAIAAFVVVMIAVTLWSASVTLGFLAAAVAAGVAWAGVVLVRRTHRAA